MDFALTPEDEAFCSELRAWLAANLPDFADGVAEFTDPVLPRSLARRRAWQKRLSEGDWAAINWPRE